ncbi:MAG: hypothetical protein K2M69_08210 [Muribaculaceae bacterium]|nr:hypothetical protein [Muribaculaceae bacterium]
MEEKEMTLEDAKARISELEKAVEASREEAEHYQRLYTMYRDEADLCKNILTAVDKILSLVRSKV